jgi:ATP-dependent RNA helicase RhlE
MKFTELRLAEPIVRAVSDKGYTTPSPIQAQAIPVAIEGKDVLGCAQTGTGKTCAFALPILHRLSDPSNNTGRKRGGGRTRAPRALVLCPTRELAMQIFDSFVGYGKHLKLRHTVVFGGVSQGKQVRSIRDGVDVLIATPGRLLDLINQGHIDLREIEVLVLDEADRMLDMGFINDIRKVVAMTREDRQTLFFSATVSREIRRLADSILENPVTIETTPESTTVDAIAQRIYMVERANKPMLLERLLSDKDVGRALVFSRTKYGADKLVKNLRRSNIDAEAIHGDKTQNARTRAMRRFKSGSTKILVATDIASRGIDVDEITHVVNFDMPIDPETYVHRIGRTARAGATGIALSFCDFDEMGIYRSIERRAKIQIEVADDHDDLTFDAPPPQRRQRPNSYKGARKPYSNNRSRNTFGNNNGSANVSESSETSRPKKSRSGTKNRKSNSGSNASSFSSEPSRGSRSAGPTRKPKKGNGYPRNKPGAGVRSSKPSSGSGKKTMNKPKKAAHR